MHYIRYSLDIVKKSVEWVAISLFVWITLVSFIQLVFRWLDISGLGWADRQIRFLVLWIGLIGGILAAANGRHIQINVFDNLLNKKYSEYIHRFINIVAGAFTLILLWISLSFIQSERTNASIVEGFFFGITIPLWWIELLIPMALFLMSMFFFGKGIIPADKESNGEER